MLDFGLAKALDPTSRAARGSEGLAGAASATEPGVILGRQLRSPEQAR